ncbi:hypothetical protein [Duganella sp. BJB475]|uniref:hypothetical protein n=1 Tax=Duganella sp. BJB475 TaxID=2233914 RepID=UPI000EDFBFE7|nr:hypothetical protein [Duganella sp. BJB475]RFP19153.1 hypothetical protein D0T23_05065 [Duganella sp. BJB475]
MANENQAGAEMDMARRIGMHLATTTTIDAVTAGKLAVDIVKMLPGADQTPAGYIASQDLVKLGNCRTELWAAPPATDAVPVFLGAPPAKADVCAEMRALCSSCGGTGDVHRTDGVWMGECTCALAVAERDAARYRWLRNQMSFSTLSGAPAEMNLRAMIPAPDHNCHTDWMEQRFDASVDRAIDAAMLAAAPAAGSIA